MSMLGALSPTTINRKVVFRPYQNEFVDATWSAFNEYRKVMSVLPTGGGKTTCAGELIARTVEAGGRALVLAHTRKLVRQFRDAVERDFGIWSEIEMGDIRADRQAPVICSTIQSMVSRIRNKTFNPNDFDLTVIDECHRSLAKGHKNVVEYFSEGSKCLGITATPRRGDQRDLMKFFEFKAYDVPISQLIDDGYLAPLTIHNIPLTINLASKPGKGDYSDEEVSHAIEPYLEQIADYLIERHSDRCSMIFLPLIPTSKLFSLLLNERGLKCKHVDGTMSEEDIDSALKQLERGDIRAVTCSMLLTEGVDVRPANLILNLRPTRSWTLYNQIVGRGTRLFGQHEKDQVDGCKWPLKTDCIILDPLYQCDEHSMLQRPSSILSESPEEAVAIDLALKAGGNGADLMEAKKSAKADREKALMERLMANANKKKRTVSAMDFFTATGNSGLADYEPVSRWEQGAITPGQRETLIKIGIDIDSVTCRGQASALLDTLRNRRVAGLCTIKQAKEAMRLGMEDAYNRKFADVSHYIDSRRSGIDPFDGMPD